MEYLLGRLIDPALMPLHPGERVYWLYLVSALVLCGVIYFLNTRGKARSLRGFLRYCFPRQLLLHRSALLDYRFFVVNRIAFGLLLLPSAPAAALGAAMAISGALQALL